MRAIAVTVDPRWTLALAAIVAVTGVRAEPPAADARPETLEILVEEAEEVEEEADEVRVEGDAAVPAEPAVPQLLERLLEGVLRAVPGQADARAIQRRQIAEQAGQFEQMLQPLLHLELQLARQSCPGIDREGRRAVVAAGSKAVKEAATALAAVMMGVQRQRPGQEARRTIHAAVVEAVRRHAPPEEFARYAREAELRSARRAEAARLRIVLKLDEEFDLNADQRESVLADLRSGWQDAWMTGLDEHDGMSINGRRIAPDFAAACIEPHLTDEQKRGWRAWCQVAGQRRLGTTGHFPGNVQGPPQPDAWWTQ